jgi:PTS system mannose-specific IIC component
MNLRAISRPGTLLFYMVGFILSQYVGLPVIAVAVLGGIIGYFYTTLLNNNSQGVAVAATADEEEDF